MKASAGNGRLAVDIGGTFTDVALALPDRQITTKTLTTPHAPEQGVLTGIAKVLNEAGIAPGDGRDHHPRYHAGDQCADRAQGRENRADRDRRPA